MPTLWWLMVEMMEITFVILGGGMITALSIILFCRMWQDIHHSLELRREARDLRESFMRSEKKD